MEDVLEMDTMLTPEGPSGRLKPDDSADELSQQSAEKEFSEVEPRGRRRRQDTAEELRERRRRMGGSDEELRGRRRRTEDSEEEQPGLSASADVEMQGSSSGSKKVQIVPDRYYRRRSVDGRMCKCYNRDQQSGSRGYHRESRGYSRDASAGSHGSRGYSRDFSAGSHGSRGYYSRHKSPDHLDVHPR